MIDPNNIINFNRKPAELQEFLLFGIVVAGKGAQQQSRKLDQFLKPRIELKMSPFEYIQHLHSTRQLMRSLKRVKMGQYNRIARSFYQASLRLKNLKRCTLNDLLSIDGLGPKTARFFIVFSRKNAEHAVLDTHILKFMRDCGIETPKATPSGGKYLKLEKEFLSICASQNRPVAEFDLDIWKAYSQGNGFADLEVNV
jgi:hypothetical protein